MATFEQVIPVLRIFDISKTTQFYIDWLGFKIDWQHSFGEGMPIYMQISRGDLVLHLSEHHGDCCPGAKVFVHITGIEDLHRELSDKDYKYNRPGLEQAPWNARTVTVKDPFGNQILFNENLD